MKDPLYFLKGTRFAEGGIIPNNPPIDDRVPIRHHNDSFVTRETNDRMNAFAAEAVEWLSDRLKRQRRRRILAYIGLGIIFLIILLAVALVG